MHGLPPGELILATNLPALQRILLTVSMSKNRNSVNRKGSGIYETVQWATWHIRQRNSTVFLRCFSSTILSFRKALKHLQLVKLRFLRYGLFTIRTAQSYNKFNPYAAFLYCRHSQISPHAEYGNDYSNRHY